MSGRKNNLLRYHTIKAGDGSGDLISDTTNIQFLDNIGFQIDMTGTMTGQFFVQCSADYDRQPEGQVVNPGHWVSLTLNPSATVTGGSPTDIYIDINQLSAPWIRLIYTHTSGSGTVEAFLTAKMV